MRAGAAVAEVAAEVVVERAVVEERVDVSVVGEGDSEVEEIIE